MYAITSGAAVVLAGTSPILRQVSPPLPQAALVLRHRRRPRLEGTNQIAASHGAGGGQVERDGHARHRHAGSWVLGCQFVRFLIGFLEKGHGFFDFELLAGSDGRCVG